MTVQWLRRGMEKTRNEAQGILLRRYPTFIFDDGAAPVLPPVFVLHAIDAATLEPMLAYLAGNEYSTITADEYVECARGGRPRGRCVMLTVDDGDSTLYTDVYPLLQHYRQRVVAYVVPGALEAEAPRIEAASTGTPGRVIAVPGPSSAGGPAARRLVSAVELREMHASGLVDVQSHSLFHHSIGVSDRVRDFNRPGLDLSFLSTDVVPRVRVRGDTWTSDDLPLGVPLLDCGARYGPAPAVEDAPEVIEACVRRVADAGGEKFFERRQWRRELLDVVRDHRSRGNQPRRETTDEQEAAILCDLRESRERIERLLGGGTVRHLCFPWHRSSPQAVRLALEAGYVSAAFGSLLPVHGARSFGVQAIPRLPPWYLWRLPGRGRRSLRRVLWTRSLTGGAATQPCR